MAAPAWPLPSQCCRPDWCGHGLGEVGVLAASRELVVLVLLLSALRPGCGTVLHRATPQHRQRGDHAVPCRTMPCHATRDHATARGTQTEAASISKANPKENELGRDEDHGGRGCLLLQR